MHNTCSHVCSQKVFIVLAGVMIASACTTFFCATAAFPPSIACLATEHECFFLPAYWNNQSHASLRPPCTTGYFRRSRSQSDIQSCWALAELLHRVLKTARTDVHQLWKSSQKPLLGLVWWQKGPILCMWYKTQAVGSLLLKWTCHVWCKIALLVFCLLHSMARRLYEALGEPA